MILEDKINEFIVFVIENYKVTYNMNGKEVYDLFVKYGVFDYLEKSYDMLHTKGKDYIINEVHSYIENK